MKPIGATIRDYAELARVSNLPTTFTNVLVGCAIGSFGLPPRGTGGLGDFPWIKLPVVWLAIACLYTAGMALNDVIDAPIDAMERPNRPIPSGRISRRAAQS